MWGFPVLGNKAVQKRPSFELIFLNEKESK
jgi:hypothetical protein